MEINFEPKTIPYANGLIQFSGKPLSASSTATTDLTTPEKKQGKEGLYTYRLASATKNELILWLYDDIDFLQVQQAFSFESYISSFYWSPDSNFILCSFTGTNDLEVVSVTGRKNESLTISQTMGNKDIYWLPDSRHIAIVSDFNLRLSIWSIEKDEMICIDKPKDIKQSKMKFSCSGKYFAVVKRQNSKDYVSIISTDSLISQTPFLIKTNDCSEIAWSPTVDSQFAVFDSFLNYKVCLYLINGTLLGEYSEGLDILGIQTLTWDNSGMFYIAGDYNDNISLFSSVASTPLIRESVPSQINRSYYKDVVIFEEIEEYDQFTYEILDQANCVLPVLPYNQKKYFQTGVSLLKTSSCGIYFCSKNENMPRCCFIWETRELKLIATIIFINKITSMEWNPVFTVLGICTGKDSVCLWTTNGCFSVQLPMFQTDSKQSATRIKWTPEGSNFLITGRGRGYLGDLHIDVDCDEEAEY